MLNCELAGKIGIGGKQPKISPSRPQIDNHNRKMILRTKIDITRQK